jgi:hypothetical protein
MEHTNNKNQLCIDMESDADGHIDSIYVTVTHITWTQSMTSIRLKHPERYQSITMQLNGEDIQTFMSEWLLHNRDVKDGNVELLSGGNIIPQTGFTTFGLKIEFNLEYLLTLKLETYKREGSKYPDHTCDCEYCPLDETLYKCVYVPRSFAHYVDVVYSDSVAVGTLLKFYDKQIFVAEDGLSVRSAGWLTRQS